MWSILFISLLLVLVGQLQGGSVARKKPLHNVHSVDVQNNMRGRELAIQIGVKREDTQHSSEVRLLLDTDAVSVESIILVNYPSKCNNLCMVLCSLHPPMSLYLYM